MPKITKVDNIETPIDDKQKENNEKRWGVDYNNFPREKNHWEKYEIYYLVFGSFFLMTLIVLINSSSINSKIRKINQQLTDRPVDSDLDFFNRNWGGGNSGNDHDHGGQVSKFEGPDLTRQNKNWVNDVIIQKGVKEGVKTWINTFKYLPQYQTKKKIELDNHVLFCGPPGSGKSFIIEEFCHNETDGFVLAHFETQIWAGSSIEKQQKVFNQAKELLKYNTAHGKTKPVAIVIEEIDSVGTKDTSGRNKSSQQEVNGLLKIFDEINKDNLNIIIVGTTNNPEMLNEALVRPGRLGRRILVNYPTEEELKKLTDYCQKIMEKSWKNHLNEQEWKDKDKDKDKVVEWSSDYWTNVYQSIQKTAKEFYKKETGFNFRDLQKAVVSSLAAKIEENNSKIIPDSQVFEKELQSILQNRVDDQENKLRNQYNFPPKVPDDTRDPDKQPKPKT